MANHERAATLLRGHRGQVLCVEGGSAAENPRLLLSGSEDRTARVWDVRERARAARLLSGVGDAVTSVAFVPLSPHTVLLAAGRDLHWYDLRRSDAVLLTEPAHTLARAADEEINHVAVAEDGRHAAVAEDAGRAVVVDLGTREARRALGGKHGNICSAAAFRSSRPKELLTAGLDQRLFVWDFSRGAAFAEAKAPAGDAMVNPPMINSLHAHPRDSLVAAALGSGAVALYDATAKRWAALLNGHHAAVAHAHFPGFDPERLLVSAGGDRTVALWDLERCAGRPLAEALARRPGAKKKKKNKKAAAAPELPPCERTAPSPVFRWEDELTLNTEAMADRFSVPHKPNWTATLGDRSHVRLYVADTTPDIRCYEM